MPNLLVNGDFQIWQRGESFTITGDEAFHYTADCWCVYASTGQTVTVKKTSDGLIFSGTSAITQRMLPLKVGQKYIFLAKVDNDVKTLQITGGTYTENSFLKYNKTGSYEQLQIKSNGNTKVGNARLWKGTTVYPIIEEDEATALLRSQQYLYVVNNVRLNIQILIGNTSAFISIPIPTQLANKPTISIIDNELEYYLDNSSGVTTKTVDKIGTVTINNNFITVELIGNFGNAQWRSVMLSKVGLSISCEKL